MVVIDLADWLAVVLRSSRITELTDKVETPKWFQGFPESVGIRATCFGVRENVADV